MKKYRFFFHYHKQKKQWSVHWKNKCSLCPLNSLVVQADCEGKENTRQPYAVMQGFSSCVKVYGGGRGGITIYD